MGCTHETTRSSQCREDGADRYRSLPPGLLPCQYVSQLQVQFRYKHQSQHNHSNNETIKAGKKSSAVNHLRQQYNRRGQACVCAQASACLCVRCWSVYSTERQIYFLHKDTREKDHQRLLISWIQIQLSRTLYFPCVALENTTQT